MIDFVLATGNRNKVAEYSKLLSPLADKVRILSLKDVGITGDVVEDGDTFEENSVIKSSVPAALGYIGVADDSGLTVDALDGAPGIYSARYAGENVTYRDNNEKLLRELEGVKDRGAKFVCVISITIPDGTLEVPEELVDRHLSAFASERCGRSVRVIAVRGECPGVITEELRGREGFGYDPLFLYEPSGVTFAEMSHEEKNAVSHRGAAARAFLEIIKKLHL